MKKGTFIILAAALLAGCVGTQLARPASQGICYRVSGGKNAMTLLGSIHVGSREMYPFHTSIRQALRDADTLVFECDTQSAEAAQLIAARMQGEENIEALFGPDCAGQLIEAAQKIGHDPDALLHLKPWAVLSMLSVNAAADGMGVSSSQASRLGVEAAVRREAGNRSLQWLETVEEQLGTLENLSHPLEQYLLESACTEILTGKATQDTSHWPDWWRDGKAEAFAQNYLESLRSEAQPELALEYHQALITGRNVRMARKLQQMLESEEPHSYFVTMGLMHLVLPEDSVVHELQKLGYTMERIP